jgi:hypothetical protein
LAGEAGAGEAGVGAPAGRTATGAGLADVAGAGTADEPEAAEATVDEAEPTTEATGKAAAEVTGDVAEPTVVVTADPADVCVDVRGGSAAVAAWAGRENSSMTARIPAAASAACIAARAMRRTIGCTMSSSHSTRNRAARLPPGGGSKLACPHWLFGHHRTVSPSIGQEREVTAKQPNGADRLQDQAQPVRLIKSPYIRKGGGAKQSGH